MLTALNSGTTEHIDENVSSLVDTWILVRDIERDGERNRGIYIMKSRGMKHSNEVREFIISSKGLALIEVFRDNNDGVLIGSARKERQKEKMAQTGQNGNGQFKARIKK
jgi:circadian clock protein KaiC